MSIRRRTARRIGFTLIEMMVSLAVFAVLVGAMGSALVLSTHALPTRTSAAGRTVAASEVLQQMTDELRGALYLTEAEPTSVAFVLPDRDGDGNPEAVRYAWSGGAGAALTRQHNGTAAAALLGEVDGFALSYPSVDHVRTLPGARIESGEVLLSKATNGNDAKDFSVKDTDRIGFVVKPNLPAGTVDWRITRTLWSSASRGSADGVSRYRLSHWQNNRPADAAVDSTLQYESSLGTNASWVEVAFGQGGPFVPGETAAVTATREDSGSGHSVNIRYFDKDASPSNMFTTTNRGDSWSVESGGRAVLHYAYGRYTSLGPAWTLTRRRVVAVDLSLNPGGGGAAALAASVELINAPDAVSRREADFDADPSKQDLDLDGQTDWKGKDKAFKQSQFAGGVWSLAVEGQIDPSNPPLDEPLTLDVWLEDTTDDGYAGWAEARFDRGGGACGRVRLSVSRVGSTQRFRIELTRAGGGITTLLEAERPVGVPAKLGVVVDPSGDRVVGSIDDAVGPCLPYERVADDDKEPSLRLAAGHEEVSGARVRHVALRVGGEVADVQAATGSGGGGGVIGGLFNLFR